MEAVTQHGAEIDRCNQRGGRMLSVTDLISAGTLSIDLAAYAFAAIGRGASFMVGASPGGAGKTAVMGALLNFVPPHVELRAADGQATLEEGLAKSRPIACYICHEIGSGPYYAYLWGHELRRFFRLPQAGHMVATNLHADNLEESCRQVCGENDVPEEDFRRMNLVFFLTVRRSGPALTREVTEAYESDWSSPHRRVYGANTEMPPGDASALVGREEFERAVEVIRALVASGRRTLLEVRAFLLPYLSEIA